MYFLKLSDTNGFWKKVRITDPELHLIAKSYQKMLKKFRKAEKDVKFLTDCKSSNVYLKFVRWKNIKSKSPCERIKYYSCLLNEALDKRHKELKTLRTKHDEIKTTLLNKATFIKGKLIVYSVDRLQSNVCKRTTQRYEKKLDALLLTST